MSQKAKKKEKRKRKGGKGKGQSNQGDTLNNHNSLPSHHNSSN
jgi:hypothetical protein